MPLPEGLALRSRNDLLRMRVEPHRQRAELTAKRRKYQNSEERIELLPVVS
jgi:hypothetical protein